MARGKKMTAREVAAAADRADPRPVGRPSKYSPAYRDLVIEHMSEGASLTSFAAEIGVARSTINEWIAEHAEFSEAVKIAKAKCAAWWEKVNRAIARDGGGTGSATAVIFGLKNMAPDDWADRKAVEVTGSKGGPVQTLDVTKLSDAALRELMAATNEQEGDDYAG